ncbi:HEAT repeat domain-containing protein [Zunongwangia endophytica]|uniref:HEAT repeat domain-containing protein n=1 Tax=Zunongwangia endophytica TaxID=1808945 RepID=A0ABV8HG11_9FLAO|nr:HEAT repeat domain-containing protein [Zunongwangia endophytica]MDN3594194.1 HEAT repeat domain-containing protein [Zunongwangia endophytica]
MKKYIIILGTFLISIASFGQNIDEFKKDFKKATETEFSESELNEMFRTYSNLLTPHSDITQLTASFKNERIVQYPLSEFKETDDYKYNIQSLLNSENPNQRLLSYLVIAGAGDKNYEKTLLEKLKTEETKGNLIWSGMALMYLQTSHTTPLFDFLIENENFGDSHMIPMYFQLNKDSLQNTAYNRINSTNLKAKILSAQLLSKTGKNEKTEKLLLDAVKNWDYNIKGYAIYSVKELEMGNLKETFVPLLDSIKTRPIAIEALANSPTKEDVGYLKQLANSEKVVSKDILNGFLESKNPESVKYWLELVSSREIPEKYYFNTLRKPLLFSDELLNDVQTTLKTTKHLTIQKTLIKVLEGREDSVSEEILLNYIDNDDSSVRYWTVDALKNTKSKIVIEKLVELLKNPGKRVSPITHILINNEIDTLQNVYTNIYNTYESSEWKRTAIEYLSKFPKEEHKGILKDVIYNKDSGFSMNRNASIGLANLNDKSSIDRIIEISEKEREGSDGNCQAYLRALSKIKGEKAKKYILSFENSESEYISELVKEIIAEW